MPRIEVRHWSSMRMNRPVHVEIDLLEAPALGHRLAADRDQDLVGGDRLASCRPRSRPSSASPLVDSPCALAPVSTSMPSSPQALRHRPRQLGVVLRQDARLRFDDGHLGAQLGEGDAELQPDIAAADDGQLARHLASAPAPRSRRSRGPPNGRDGSSTGAEPVAMTTASARITCVADLGLDLDGLAVAELRPALRRS